jgi:nucleoside 2-deoxyribosyltransferase
MRFKTDTRLESYEDRRRFVQLVSLFIEGRKDDTFAPYMPNENDDGFWCLDSGNNWKLQFRVDADPGVFEIRYRYQCAANPYEEALAAWLGIRLGLKVVPQKHIIKKVYLAGPIADCTDAQCVDWRQEFKKLWPECHDPMVRDGRGVEMTPEVIASIVEGDKADIDACDAIVVMYPFASSGTAFEAMYTYDRKKPIVLIDISERLSIWHRYHATVIVRSIPEAVAALKLLNQ